jgi:hypothetical protein
MTVHLSSKSERVGYGLKATAAAGKRAVQVERDQPDARIALSPSRTQGSCRPRTASR